MRFICILFIASCATNNEHIQSAINRMNMRINMLEQKVGEQGADIEILKASPRK